MSGDGFPLCGWCGAAKHAGTHPHCEAGDTEERRERQWLYMYGAEYEPDFSGLVACWMRELARVGSLVGERKEAGELSYPPGHFEPGVARRVRLKNGQTLVLGLGAYREDPRGDGRSFARTEARGTTPHTERATLAALAVLEGAELGSDAATRGKNLSRIRDHLKNGMPLSKISLESVVSIAKIFLQHYRPSLDLSADGCSKNEWVELMVGTCERVAAVCEATRRLADYLEFGVPGRYTQPEIEDAQTDVYAAELHHFAGLSWPEVAKKLGRDISDGVEKRGAAETARQKGKRGVEIYIQALGGESAWREYKGAQRRRYHNMQ